MSPRKSAKRRVKKKPYLGILSILLLICISVVATIYLIFLRPGTVIQTVKPQASPILNTQDLAPLPPPTEGEEYIIEQKIPETGLPQPTEPPPPPEETITEVEIETAPPKKQKPKLAIIIDDIGYKKKLAMGFIDLDLNLTFSILPHSPYGKELSKVAVSKGHDILLHLPMEATDKKWDPGPGALFLEMNKDETVSTLEKNLDFVPMAVGINNHMGSIYSENVEAMTLLLKGIKKRNLFFIDSLTSAKSIAYKTAKKMEVKTARRDIFLDNNRENAAITKQLEKLVEIAEKRGHAIGIGHPYESTLKVLAASTPLLGERVEIVPIQKLMN